MNSRIEMKKLNNKLQGYLGEIARVTVLCESCDIYTVRKKRYIASRLLHGMRGAHYALIVHAKNGEVVICQPCNQGWSYSERNGDIAILKAPTGLYNCGPVYVVNKTTGNVIGTSTRLENREEKIVETIDNLHRAEKRYAKAA